LTSDFQKWPASQAPFRGETGPAHAIRGREAIVDPEITRREVIARVASGEYKNISFIHGIATA
jgi:hypothetical protein